MDAEDVGTLGDRGGTGSGSAPNPLFRVGLLENMADEAFTRDTDEEGGIEN
jgi:hypothetical protein